MTNIKVTNTAGKSAKAAAICLNYDGSPMHTVSKSDPDAKNSNIDYFYI